MPAEANREVVRRFIEDDWSKGNLAVVDEVLSPDFRVQRASPLAGLANDAGSIKEAIANHHAAFPDFSQTIDMLVVQGDTVAVAFTRRGTHRGTFASGVAGDLAPTANQATWTGTAVYRLRDGRIVSSRMELDLHRLVQQLGAAGGSVS